MQERTLGCGRSPAYGPISRNERIWHLKQPEEEWWLEEDANEGRIIIEPPRCCRRAIRTTIVKNFFLMTILFHKHSLIQTIHHLDLYLIIHALYTYSHSSF